MTWCQLLIALPISSRPGLTTSTAVVLGLTAVISVVMFAPPTEAVQVMKTRFSDSEYGAGTRCPSYCDKNGYWHRAWICAIPPYCCVIGRNLQCCFNKSLAFKGDVVDNYNCPTDDWITTYWRVIVGAGLSLGMASLVGSVSLCFYQRRRNIRLRALHQQRQQRRDSQISTATLEGSTPAAMVASNLQYSQSHRNATNNNTPRTVFITHGRGGSAPREVGLVLQPQVQVPQPPPYTAAGKPPDYCLNPSCRHNTAEENNNGHDGDNVEYPTNCVHQQASIPEQNEDLNARSDLPLPSTSFVNAGTSQIHYTGFDHDTERTAPRPNQFVHSGIAYATSDA